MNAHDIIPETATPQDNATSTTQPDPEMSRRPESNVDQDGHCITAAYAESVNLNSGAPCDDGRSGIKSQD